MRNSEFNAPPHVFCRFGRSAKQCWMRERRQGEATRDASAELAPTSPRAHRPPLLTIVARSPSTFRQRDVTAAVKAVIGAGYEVQRVEVDAAGKIVIVTGKAEESSTVNPLIQRLRVVRP